MSISQAIAMAEIIGDQLQVIHPLALKKAREKNITMIVVDEKNPLAGGTIILPDETFNKDYREYAENMPML
jgi:aspartokinase